MKLDVLEGILNITEDFVYNTLELYAINKKTFFILVHLDVGVLGIISNMDRNKYLEE